jgi:hypothetical protein
MGQISCSSVNDAVRTYVLRVAGMQDKKKPETAALVEKLLQPLITWESAKTAKKAASPADPAAPAAPPAESKAAAAPPKDG